MIAGEWGTALGKPNERNGNEVVERDGENHERHEDAIPVAGVYGGRGVEVGCADGKNGDKSANDEGAAITHKHFCLGEIEDQERKQRTK